MATLLQSTDLSQTPWPQGVVGWWAGTVASLPPAWEVANGSVSANDSGYTRPNLLGKFLKGIPAAGTPGTLVGAANHTHTVGAHNHGNTATKSADNGSPNTSGTTVADAHYHATTNSTASTTAAANNDPSHLRCIPIVFTKKPGASGTRIQRTDLKSDALPPLKAIVATIGSVPDGWGECDGTTQNGVVKPDLRDRYLKGIPTTGTAPGSTGGTSSHSHAWTHTHATEAESVNQDSAFGAGTGKSTMPHTHGTSSAASVTSSTDTHLPESVEVRWIIFVGHGASAAAHAGATLQADDLESSVRTPRGIVIAFPDTPPSGWQHCDGAAWANGTPTGYGASRPNLLDRFIKHTALDTDDGGTASGAHTHSHTDPHVHNTGGPSATRINTSGTNNSATTTHTHALSVASESLSGDLQPPYYEVAFIVRD